MSLQLKVISRHSTLFQVSVCVDDTVTYRAEMSLLMLQLSLCTLTVIQLTSSLSVYNDVIKQRPPFKSNSIQSDIRRQVSRLEKAIGGKHNYTVGRA